jgi:hypothetical protein
MNAQVLQLSALHGTVRAKSNSPIVFSTCSELTRSVILPKQRYFLAAEAGIGLQKQ